MEKEADYIIEELKEKLAIARMEVEMLKHANHHMREEHHRNISAYTSKIAEMRAAVNSLVSREGSLYRVTSDGGLAPLGPIQDEHWYAWLPIAGNVLLESYRTNMERVFEAGLAARAVTITFRELDNYWAADVNSNFPDV